MLVGFLAVVALGPASTSWARGPALGLGQNAVSALSRGGWPCPVSLPSHGLTGIPGLSPGLCGRPGRSALSSVWGKAPSPVSPSCALASCGPASWSGAAVTESPSPSAPSAGSGGWTVAATPAPRTNLWSQITGTTCVSASDCWAVGWSNAGSSWRSLIEHWNGHGWNPVRSPAPRETGLVISGLNAITCLSASRCWAVGDYYTSPSSYHTLIERWDGRSWSLVAAPSTGEVDVPVGIACASQRDCWAVGYTFFILDCPATGCGWYSLTEHWDGRSWRRVSSPNPFPGDATAAPLNILQSVACASRSDCWTAGYVYGRGNSYQPLLLRWNGHRWSQSSSPSGLPAGGGVLLGLACRGRSACWAVGAGLPIAGQSTEPEPLAWHFNGIAWQISDPAPAAASQGELLSVSCPLSNRCTAVGYQARTGSGVSDGLIERWGEGSWTPGPAPVPVASKSVQLDSVSCLRPAACVAGGEYLNPLSVLQPLGDTLAHRGWRTTLSQYSGSASAGFSGVACADSAFCWAVGQDLARGRAVISHWDGRGWGVVPSAHSSSAGGDILYGAACLSRRDCWAVGAASYASSVQALIEHWDGNQWRDFPSPTAPGLPTAPSTGDLYVNGLFGVGVEGPSVSTSLYGVTCSSPSECWAVGTIIGPDGERPLLERWNGRSWSLVAQSTALAQGGAALDAVRCASGTDCWAVGEYSVVAASGPLIEHWNGIAWTPSLGIDSSHLDFLTGVACPSHSDCWAVGLRVAGSGAIQSLIEHWNGSAWKRTSPADGEGDAIALYGIACLGATRCWAVGGQQSGTDPQTVFERWNGRAWTASPGPGLRDRPTGSVLGGITCTTHAPACWTVGWSYSATRVRTLAERHLGPR